MKGIQIIKFKKVFIESLRIFGLLLHKCWLVRKRNWIVSLVGEILVPISLMLWILSTSEGLFFGFDIANETHYERQSYEQLIDLKSRLPVQIMYAPSNPFTDKLMKTADDCFKNKANLTGFDSESSLIAHFMNSTRYCPWDNVIFFDESTDESTKHLRYQIKTNELAMYSSYTSRNSYNMADYYTDRYFVQIQICLDQSYIKIKSNKSIPKVFIQQIPDPGHTRPKFAKNARLINGLFLAISFTIPLFFEIATATKEKFLGLNILISINGISNALNFLSWLISGILLMGTLCIILFLLMAAFPLDYSSPFLIYSNPLIVFTFLLCHVGHSVKFGIHLSAYFAKSSHLLCALVITNGLVISFRIFVFQYMHRYLIPYVGVIVPAFLLIQGMEEIDAYETIAVGVQWSNLFTNAIPVIRSAGSLGSIMVLSIIGTFFHFLLAVYMYAIKPGKCGIGKHPLFFLMRKKKDEQINSTKNLIFYDHKNKYFEPNITAAYTPGIQIRNLKKAFNIGLFNKEKVHALQGISIDFYKGQITSILGHNGAGKSTLMSILAGLQTFTHGLILMDSKNLKNNATEVLKHVGFYAQEELYFPRLTVTEQLKFFAMVKKEDEAERTIESNVEVLIDKLKLVNVKDFLPNKLSEDQKHKLCLAIAFVGNPKTLILDEPTSRLDHENKHLVWDILLEMKGQKTILISTHDMEEADILGDQIAIMGEGRIKSYGTPLFLKKMIVGQNNIEVTLSIERWCDSDIIRNLIHVDAKIIEKRDKTMIVSVPISSSLPESLKNLKEKKKDLGVTAYILSHVGLEQVFLKVGENCDGLSIRSEVNTCTKEKLTGIALNKQVIRALLAKKFNCALIDWTILFIQVFAVFIALLGTFIIFTVLMKRELGTTLQTLQVELGMYYNPYVMYTSSDQEISNQYKSISKSFGATTVEITNTNFENELLHQAKSDLIYYSNHLIAAAEFKKTAKGSSICNAYYSETITYSLPISINLISNAIIRNALDNDYSISLYVKTYPYVIYLEIVENRIKLLSYMVALIFAIPIYLLMAIFAAHPNRESTKGIKHLQKMTGISGFTYWATMFLSDLVHFSIIVVLLVIGVICIDYSLGLQFYGITEIMIMILLLMLLAINVLPLIYSFSFIKMKTNYVLKLFTIIPIGIVIADIIMFVWVHPYRNHVNEEKYLISRAIYLLLPYVSFLRGQMHLHLTAMLNSIYRGSFNGCYAIQSKYFDGDDCEEKCLDGNCPKFDAYFLDVNVDSLNISLIYLCTTPLLYFGILALLEAEIIQKIMKKCKKRKLIESNVDEQMQFEKSIIFQKIQSLRKNQLRGVDRNTKNTSNEDLFLAHELRKYYRKVRAVEDVSFRIKGCECFGLFGVNRSGKSSILRLMTGEEILDNGIMYMGGKELKNSENNMGYCRQYDATLKCLNTYDHLRLFARLRGIPEKQIQSEVKFWIDRLNLNAYASQPSGTLSSGNNQRLNIAMALVGNPNLVLLDEPTTRMDPGARRSFWNLAKSHQMNGQTFLLVSHNMEECEILCRRMVIMVDGKLLCIGTPSELKQRFGAGYDVQIRINSVKVNKNRLDRIKKDMRLLLHCVLTNENSGYLMYHVIGAGTTWSKIYEVMDKIKSKYECVDDFLVVVRLST